MARVASVVVLLLAVAVTRDAPAAGKAKRGGPTVKVEDVAVRDLTARYIANTAKGCELSRRHEQVLGLMQEERRYSEMAGVVNLSKLELYKQSLQAIDAGMEAVRGELTPTIIQLVNAKKRPPGCADPFISRLARCVPLYGERPAICIPGWEKSAEPECQALDLAEYIRVFCS